MTRIAFGLLKINNEPYMMEAGGTVTPEVVYATATRE